MWSVVEGWLDDHQRMLIAALAKGLDHRTFFEIGTTVGARPGPSCARLQGTAPAL